MIYVSGTTAFIIAGVLVVGGAAFFLIGLKVYRKPKIKQNKKGYIL